MSASSLQQIQSNKIKLYETDKSEVHDTHAKFHGAWYGMEGETVQDAQRMRVNVLHVNVVKFIMLSLSYKQSSEVNAYV